MEWNYHGYKTSCGLGHSIVEPVHLLQADESQKWYALWIALWIHSSCDGLRLHKFIVYHQ